MLRKKQAITIVSIVVIPFLFGTMFNLATTVTGSSSSPWDKVWTAITGLESRVETLEDQSLPQGFITAPAYDSGWVTLTANTERVFVHGLGTTEVLLYIIGKDDFDRGIHQLNYGTDGEQGVGWYLLTENDVTIARIFGDYGWDEVRVMIWKISEPTT